MPGFVSACFYNRSDQSLRTIRHTEMKTYNAKNHVTKNDDDDCDDNDDELMIHIIFGRVHL